MFYIIQSNDTDILINHLTHFYKNHPNGVFDDFVVITPARVLEDWLKKSIAQKLGISTLLTGQFWGQYQWQMIKKVIDINKLHILKHNLNQEILSVPEVAVLSASIIRWQIFSYMSKHDNQTNILQNESHPLYQLMTMVCDKELNIDNKKLWQLSDGLSKIFVKYLTQRHNWLVLWMNDKHLDVNFLIQKKDELQSIYLSLQEDSEKTTTPEWMIDYYISVEKSLQFLWKTLFGEIFEKRLKLEKRFWQCLSKDYLFYDDIIQNIPKNIYLFTVNQLPQIELDFLKKLSQFSDIYLLHFNPSMMFWADIVDKNWLMQQKIIKPESVYYKEYGHTLLSRLGKSSRETFAMLAEMAGGEYYEDYQIEWIDDFNSWQQDKNHNNYPNNLLNQLKKDILMLQNDLTHHINDMTKANDWQQLKNKTYEDKSVWQLNPLDDSLMIHSCHTLKRQLEVVRSYIVRWLNNKNYDGSDRKLSDIVIFLPDIQTNYALIKSVFTDTIGVDGFLLPARVTGIASESIQQLFTAICGFYYLPTQRLYADDFYDWLLIPALHESFGLDIHEIYRAIDLLNQAGFIRGLDENHIKQTLHKKDNDYRHTLAASLDKLVASLLYGNNNNNDVYYTQLFYPFDEISAKKTQTISIQLGDEIIIEKLCLIFDALITHKQDYHTEALMIDWLNRIESDIIDRYFLSLKQSEIMRTIFDAMNNIRSSIQSHHIYKNNDTEIQLPLEFVLQTIEQLLAAQQVKSEPTGAITFGRFGSLRAINFGLVIMLGMDTGVFPRSEPMNKFDLSKAFLNQRGDRISEDDDNGAFLDAILCAKEACWIFYNGQSMTSDVPLLPAAPVVELMRYFKELNWTEDSMMDNLFIEDYLLTKHSAMPFSEDVFYKTTDMSQLALQKKYYLPPATIWQEIYHAMQRNSSNLKTIDFVSDLDVIHISNILLNNVAIDAQLLSDTLSFKTLLWSIKKPAHFFISDKVNVFDADEIKSNEEPLNYDGLSSYVFHNKFINSHVTDNQESLYNELYFGDDMPSGKMQLFTIQKFSSDFAQLLEKLKTNCANEFGVYDVLIDKLHSYDIDIAFHTEQGVHDLVLNIDLPSFDTIIHNDGLFINVMPVKYSSKYHIEAFLTHVVWQILDKPKCQWHNISVWQFQPSDNKPDFIIFDAMDYKKSVSIISKWIKYYALIKTYILAVTPNTIMDYGQLKQNNKLTEDCQGFSWLKNDEYASFVSDDNSHHAVWQYIVSDRAKQLLQLSLPILDILSEDVISNNFRQIKDES